MSSDIHPELGLQALEEQHESRLSSVNDQIPMANDEDADAAWTHILAYVAEHRASLDAGAPVEILVEADALIEAFIDRHADAFVERIEEQAAKDLTFARLVAGVHTGDMAGPGSGSFRMRCSSAAMSAGVGRDGHLSAVNSFGKTTRNVGHPIGLHPNRP